MKIILVGSSGAMGHVISDLVARSADDQIVAGVQDHLDQSHGYPVFTDFESLKEAGIDADVIIDFSHQSLTDALLDFAVDQQLPIMLATTGQTPEQEAHIHEASQKIAILNAHNTSIGVNVMAHITGELTKILYPLGYDIEIIEKHHRYKRDAPSGTANMLRDAVVDNMTDEAHLIHGREGLSEPRAHQDLAIHAIRGGDIVGEHTVLFAGHQEVLEFTHRAGSKELFATGAITGARFIKDATPGEYDMTDALDALVK